MKYWLQYWCYSCAAWRDFYDTRGALRAYPTPAAAIVAARDFHNRLNYSIRVLGPAGDLVVELS